MTELEELEEEIKQYQKFAQEGLKREDTNNGRWHLDGALWAFDAVLRMIKRIEKEEE